MINSSLKINVTELTWLVPIQKGKENMGMIFTQYYLGEIVCCVDYLNPKTVA